MEKDYGHDGGSGDAWGLSGSERWRRGSDASGGMGEDADLDLPAADGPLDIATAEVVRNALAVADAFGGGAEDPVTVAPGALDRVTVLVQSLEAVARERSRYLASLAEVRVTHTAQCRVYQQLSEALSVEAALWRLFDYMCDHRSPHQPPDLQDALQLPGSGTHISMRQVVARLLDTPGPLQDAARIVAWLESLSSIALEASESRGGGGAISRMHKGHGSWPATRATLCGDVLVRETALQREGIVPEVDPDALTRCEGRTLHTDDQQDEVDVLQATWSLVRAGRHREAVGLLCDAGQGWRAAILAGGGVHGPTPLGAAAEELAEELAQEDGAGAAEMLEEMAAEAEGAESGCRQRALWKAACMGAAEEALERARQGGKATSALSQRAFALEASLLGVVAGSFRHASAACVSWEDRCWALLRCAIEAAADAAADEHAPVGERAILDGLMQPAGEGRDGLVAAAAPGGWPAPEITGQVPSLLPSKPDVSLDQAVSAMASLAPRSPSDSSAASAARPWLLSLMARRRAALVGDLAAGCREGALHDDQGGKGRPPWRLRLAAHVGLAVYALEVLEMARDGVQDDDPRWKTLRDVGDARDVLLHAYMVALVEADLIDLVPLYARHYGWDASGDTLPRHRVMDLYDPLFAHMQHQKRPLSEWLRVFKRGCHWVSPFWMHRSACLRARNVGSALVEAPRDRADGLRWLSFSSDRAAIAWDMPPCANALLRTLALSPSPSHLSVCASVVLRLPRGSPEGVSEEPCVGEWLADVLAGDVDVWGEVLESPGKDDAAVATALAHMEELRCWTEYMACERALEPLSPSLGPSKAPLTDAQKGQARETLARMLEVLAEGWSLGGDAGAATEGGEAQLTLWCIPARVESDVPGEIPVCFPAEEAEVLGRALEDRLKRGAAEGVSVRCAPSAVSDALEEGSAGMALVRVDVTGPVSGAVRVAAGAVKGVAPTMSQETMAGYAREPMRVLGMSASHDRVARALCRAVIVPRLALHCARLRVALSKTDPGACCVSDLARVGTLGEVLGQAEDEGLGGGMGLTGLLSQEEAREILSLEKQTAFNFLSA